MADAISEFLKFLAVERSASAATISAYGSDLSQADGSLRGPHGPSWWETVDLATLTGFIDDLRRRGYAESTVVRKAAVLRSFFAFLVDNDLAATDPAKGLLATSGPPRFSKPISAAKVERLLQAIPPASRAEGKRHRAMLHLLYATGMRLTDLLALDVGDLQLRDPNPHVWRKAGKGEAMPIHDEAVAALNEYLREARPVLIRDDGQQALFLNYVGKRLTRQGFWLSLKQYAKAAGVSGAVSARGLRYSFASHRRQGASRDNPRAPQEQPPG